MDNIFDRIADIMKIPRYDVKVRLAMSIMSDVAHVRCHAIMNSVTLIIFA